VLFFNKKPASEPAASPPPRRVRQLLPVRASADKRTESERWKSFSYDELIARDKANLDITWLRDESLEDTDNLPPPEIIAREIVEDLTAALAEFEAVAAALEAASPGRPAASP
jgi:type I restriction enzyme M protein